MNENINFEKKILLNLDGYQINVFLEPLKKFLRKYNINIALHCASLEDKKVLEKNFSSNIDIYCFEDYVRKNYKNTKLDQFEFVSRQLQLSIEEIDLAFEFYKKYYFHGIISKLKKKKFQKKEQSYIIIFTIIFLRNLIQILFYMNILEEQEVKYCGIFAKKIIEIIILLKVYILRINL